MFKSIIAIVFYLISNHSYAKIEINRKVEILARTFPMGGFSKFSLEAISPLWGTKERKNDISYGFTGAQLEYRTSAVVNYISGKVFIYPIPILGIFIGQESGIKQLEKIDTFDCTTSLCKGKMQRQFTGFRLALGYKNFFFMSESKWSKITAGDDQLPFVDEMTTLLGKPGQDQSFIGLNILGLNLDDNKKLGFIYIMNEMKKRTSNSKMLSLFFEKSWSNHSLISSAGIFQTRESQKIGTLLLLYRWKNPSNLRLF